MITNKHVIPYFMASLDVDSLFTKIPLDKTINICTELLFKEDNIVSGYLSITFKESIILFDNKYYSQVDHQVTRGDFRIVGIVSNKKQKMFQILSITFKESIILFDNEYYGQVDHQVTGGILE